MANFHYGIHRKYIHFLRILIIFFIFASVNIALTTKLKPNVNLQTNNIDMQIAKILFLSIGVALLSLQASFAQVGGTVTDSEGIP